MAAIRPAVNGAAIMNVGELCSRIVVLARRTTPLSEVAKLMREHHVGSVVVVEEGAGARTPVGIVTDRDIVIEVLAMDLDCRSVTAGEVMGSELVTVREDESVLNALRLMRRRGIRRIPVLEASGTLTGIVALDDLMEVVAEEFDHISKAISGEQSREAHLRKSALDV
jgi:CBS domain-containing protein